MDELLESVLRVGILMLIVAPAIAWVNKAMAKERKRATRSLKKFRVETPLMPRIVFIGCGVAFEVMLLVVYIWQGVTMGEWDHQLMWLGHALALACFAIWGVASLQRLDVEGDELRYRTIAGRRRSTTFSHITKVEVHLQVHDMTLYADGKRFATFSIENTCINNLTRCFEREGIAIEDAVEGPTTKGKLAWAAIKAITLVFIGMAAVFSCVIVFVGVMGGEGLHMISIVPFLFVLLGVILPVLLFFVLPMRGLLMLARQERELGFSFNEDMKAHGATGTAFEDADWFIEVSNGQVVAFRRDYIKSVTKHKRTENGDECILTATDGKKHKIRGGAPTLSDLRRWFKEGPRSSVEMSEHIEDAVNSIPGM